MGTLPTQAEQYRAGDQVPRVHHNTRHGHPSRQSASEVNEVASTCHHPRASGARPKDSIQYREASDCTLH
ncbi:hypothetical protein HYQ46_008893 [Verticillium longisporum]|nr:hypothetical protein HYQ46_008893 [Verticillium longisporum]